MRRLLLSEILFCECLCVCFDNRFCDVQLGELVFFVFFVNLKRVMTFFCDVDSRRYAAAVTGAVSYLILLRMTAIITSKSSQS